MTITTWKFGRLDVIELIVYIGYIYFLTVLAILIRPNVYSLTFVVIYVYATTWYIITQDVCKNLTFGFRLFFSGAYTLGCYISYFAIHRVYWKYVSYRYWLVTLPFIYFIILKVLLQLVGCSPYANILFAIKFTKYTLTIGKHITGS